MFFQANNSVYFFKKYYSDGGEKLTKISRYLVVFEH